MREEVAQEMSPGAQATSVAEAGMAGFASAGGPVTILGCPTKRFGDEWRESSRCARRPTSGRRVDGTFGRGRARVTAPRGAREQLRWPCPREASPTLAPAGAPYCIPASPRRAGAGIA